MQKSELEIFFTNKMFVVPPYQRDFAWTVKNVEDLLEDIDEAVESNTNHFIGTFILSSVAKNGKYSVVDGQQRLTTISMLLKVLIDSLDESHEEVKIINRHQFVFASGKGYKLTLLGANKDFFEKLIEYENPLPENKSQKLLKAAFSYIQNRIGSLKNDGDDKTLIRWLDCIKSFSVLEFIEPDEGRAIRIFGTVNDRGVQLTNMEKAKSLLIYYSNRFLEGKLDSQVNELFGRAFNDYNIIKEVSENPSIEIRNINNPRFSEDSIMRYHFLSYDSEYYDYTATEDFVLNGFLKYQLKALRGNELGLSGFISYYTDDLSTFFMGLSDLIDEAGKNPKLYKIFTILNLSAFLYPLIVRLHMRNLLDYQINMNPKFTLLDLIEITDLRVYKIRGTDPSKDVLYLANEANTLTPDEIVDKLLNINKRFMSDVELYSYLEKDMYKNWSLPMIFIEYNEKLNISSGKCEYSLDDLKRIYLNKPTIEHVFPQSPTFQFPGRGFVDEEEYHSKNDKLGNLTILLQSLNSKCQNKTLEQKVSDDNLYKSCCFATTHKIVQSAIAKNGKLDSEDIDLRTKELSNFIKVRWPIWG